MAYGQTRHLMYPLGTAPRVWQPMGAVDPSTCDPNTQYFDSQYTQTCRAFADVGPPGGATAAKPGSSFPIVPVAIGAAVVLFFLMRK